MARPLHKPIRTIEEDIATIREDIKGARKPGYKKKVLVGHESCSFWLQLEDCMNGPVKADVVRNWEDMFLGRRWAQCTCIHKVQQGYLLTFRYARDGVLEIRAYDDTLVNVDCCVDSSDEGAEDDNADEDNEE